jgi:hypothetical protein
LSCHKRITQEANMKHWIKRGAVVAAALAAVTFAATPSQAQRWHGHAGWHGGHNWHHGGWHGRYDGWHGNGGYWGAAAAGFATGAIVGAAASNAYYDDYYGPGYAYYGGPAYYGAPAYGYYGAYAYAPRRQSLPEYRDGTGRAPGSDALMSR